MRHKADVCHSRRLHHLQQRHPGDPSLPGSTASPGRARRGSASVNALFMSLCHNRIFIKITKQNLNKKENGNGDNKIQTTNQETSLSFFRFRLPDRRAHFTKASERQHHYEELSNGHTPTRKLLGLIWRERSGTLHLLFSFRLANRNLGPVHLLFGDLGIPDVCAEIFYVVF